MHLFSQTADIGCRGIALTWAEGDAGDNCQAVGSDYTRRTAVYAK